MTPEEQARHNQMLQIKRNDQALAIRKQILDNAGDILGETPSFLMALSQWVQYGKESQGRENITSLDRELQWCLHSTITRYPEVWIRAPVHRTEPHNTTDENTGSSNDDDVHE